MLLSFLLASVALADDPVAEHQRYLTHAEAELRLVPELIGPPATRYDHTPEAHRPDTLAAEIEVRMLGADADRYRPPAGLRCFADATAATLRQGKLRPIQRRFLAEHCGLAVQPELLGWFEGPDDADTLADLARGTIKGDLGGDETATVAVGLQQADGRAFGVITMAFMPIEVQPIDRVVDPGGAVTVDGLLTTKGELSGLFVDRPDDAVEIFEVPANGVLRQVVEMPDEPGLYRATIARLQKDRFADGDLFFALYAGTPLPDRYVSPVEDRRTETQALPEREAEVVAAVAAARAERDRPELEHLPEGDVHLRGMLLDLPRRERAQVRYLRRKLGNTPIPDQPHGGWSAAIGSGLSADEIVWTLLTNPAVRSGLIGPEADRIAVGAAPISDAPGWSSLLVVTLVAPPTGDDVADHVRQVLRQRFQTAHIQTDARAEEALDRWATAVATGEAPVKKALKKALAEPAVGRAFPAGCRIHIASSGPGQEPDLSTVDVAKNATRLAVGSGVGDLGHGGSSTTVYMVVVGL